jgi:hypothetical protein
MVDRTIGKLDEIALSIKSGSNISSHAEDRQILREAFYAVIEKTRNTQKPLVIARQPEVPFSAEPQVTPKRPVIQVPAEPKEIPKRPNVQIRGDPKEIDRRRLQKEILQDLNIFGITRNSFSKSKRNIETVKIPEKMDVNKRLADAEEEIHDLTWLYE